MRGIRWSSALAGMLLAASSVAAQESEKGFVSLFDGKMLNGWVGAVEGYVVEDGKLVCLKEKGGNLYTEKEYEDFVLRFEFKLEAGSNNGLGIRAPLETNAAYAGMEIQILDDTAEKYAQLKPYQYHGSVYGVAPAKRGHLRPLGEWNREEVVCRGRKVTVILNGVTIVDVDLDRAAEQGTADGRAHPGIHRVRGHIGFLGHGSRVEFRDIRIKDLSPAAGGEIPVPPGCGRTWQARWIALPKESPSNSWLCFRKTFDLKDKPAAATAYIAADSKYWLWVNGRLVVFEGQLKRGPTPADTYYDEVDLAPHLQQGSNTLAVLVWYWGKHGFSHRSSGRAGLVFEADLGGQAVASGASWKARAHPAYGSTEPPWPNFRLPEHNIAFDARKDIAGWTAAGYDDSKWTAAEELGVPPAGPWGRLWKRPIPLFKDYGLKDYVNAGDLPAVGDGKTIVAKLPYNAHVTPYLKVNASAGLKIDIRTDDYLVGTQAKGTPSLRAEYVTRRGVQEYESLGWINGHEVRYDVPEGIKILSLRYRETGYDADFAGAFECDDEALNALWRKACRTLYVTMRDTYMDCPDRERAQWWGDEVNELGEAFYALSPAAALLARKGIGELVRWQRPDKTLYAPVPEGNWDKELPPQMLASVGEYGFWTYYEYTGDKDAIVEAYPRVRDYLGLWKLGGDGLVVHRPGEWDWTDWGKNIDVAVTDNAWMYSTLGAAVKMARLAGADADVGGYEATRASIAANFNKTFWTGQEFRSPGYKGQTDDRANAMAVVAGLAERSQWPAIRKVLAEQQHASPYMEKYVLESLYLMERPEEAVARMKGRYGDMITHPSTTLWEHFSLQGTYNHAWSGGPLTLLSQYAAGVAPTSPAYATWHVLPRMGPLKRIRATVPSAAGEIRVSMERDDGGFRMTVTSPAGTAATVGVPKGDKAPARITVNGKAVWEGGQAVGGAQGVTFRGDAGLWYEFTVAPGEWEFKAES